MARPLSLRPMVFLWLAAMAVVTARPCAAHPATIAAATAKVAADGTFTVQARFDLLAFALDDTPFRIGDGPMNALLDGPSADLQAQLSDAEHRFREDFAASGGTGPGVVNAVTFPTAADVQRWRDSGVTPRLPVMMTVVVQGHLPPGATSVSFRFPEVLGTIVVTTELPYQEPFTEPVEDGAFSTPVPIAPMATPPPVPSAPPVAASAGAKPVPVKVAPVVPRPAPKPMAARRAPPAHAPAHPSAVVARVVPKAVPVLPVPAAPTSRPRRAAKAAPPNPASSSPLPASVPVLPVVSTHPVVSRRPHIAWETLVWRYVKMGYTHILPEGVDHILFVLGLFLLSTRLKPLLWQITAFTVAHSLTLALSLYGIVRLPPTIVEPIIAASIAFVAIENLFTTDLKPWRPFVVFGFGLVHGMGFAGALTDLGLQRHDFLTALVGFNAGVELGQLSVVGLALLAVGWFRQRRSYRRLVVVPASVAIAAVAVFWTIQRVWWG